MVSLRLSSVPVAAFAASSGFLGSTASAQVVGLDVTPALLGDDTIPGQVVIIGDDGSLEGILSDGIIEPRGTALAPDGSTFFVAVTNGLGTAPGFIQAIELSESAPPVIRTFVSEFDPDGPGGPASPQPIIPFDLEIGPGGDLFISDAGSQNILKVPTSGPDTGVPEVFASGFVPSGIGFGPTGSLFAGAQPSSPNGAGLFEILPDGTATQVGVLDQPFDVQVDSAGNVFVNNNPDFPGPGGEIAFFEALGALDTDQPVTPITSETFSPIGIRGLGIGPAGSELEDAVFATTADFTVVQFDPFDPAAFDPTDTGEIFAGPGGPLDNVIGDPFAFDIVFNSDGGFQLLIATDDVIPEPTAAVAMLLGGLGLIARRRRA